MHRIYKSGNFEISEDAFSVKADLPPPPVMVQQETYEQQERRTHSSGVGITAAEDYTTAGADPQYISALIDEAHLQAAQIIATARQRGNDEYSAIRVQAQHEAAEIRNDAFNEGKSEGYAEGAAAKVTAIEQTIERLEHAVAEIEGKVAGAISEQENNLKWAVLEVSSKVLHRIIERDELELVELVKAAVEQSRGAEWIDLHLAQESKTLIERLQRELAPIREIEIVPSDLPAGSCLLDMPNGKLDASIDAQLTNLYDYFRSHTLDL